MYPDIIPTIPLTQRDVMRSVHRKLNPQQHSDLCKAKRLGEEIDWFLANVAGDPRAIALARTKIEEAVMWAVKGITA